MKQLKQYQVEILKEIVGDTLGNDIALAVSRGDTIENIVYSSKNYDMFSRINANRDIVESHVDELIESMDHKLLPTYIMVDREAGIAEGQHRFEALKRLNKRIPYYFADNLTLDDLATLQGSEDWKDMNYLKSNIDQGKDEYVEFNRIMKKYNVTPARMFSIFAQCEGVRQKQIKEKFRSGNLDVDSIKCVEDFLIALEDFSDFDFYKQTSFVVAFLNLYFKKEYNHEIMKKKLTSGKNYRVNIRKRNNYHEYLHDLTYRVYSKDAENGFTRIIYDLENKCWY